MCSSDLFPSHDKRSVSQSRYEPCYGQGDLVNQLDAICVGYSDIDLGKNAFDLTKEDVWKAQYIVTNPPWSRNILHPMIEHFIKLKPTWLLFDADWMHTKQAKPYLDYCEIIVSIGRLKWIPDTKMTGKDNCCWYLFDQNPKHNTEFHC